MIAEQVRANRAGMIVNTVDLKRKFYDPMKEFRDMAIGGMLSNGPAATDDPRSKDTTSL